MRGSSLAAGSQAVLAAEAELAGLAGGSMAVIAGLAGAREHDGCLSFAPKAPTRRGP